MLGFPSPYTDQQIWAGGQFATFPGSCEVTPSDSELSLAAEGEADDLVAIDDRLAVDGTLIADTPLGPDCWFLEDGQGGESSALTGGGSTIY